MDHNMDPNNQPVDPNNLNSFLQAITAMINSQINTTIQTSIQTQINDAIQRNLQLNPTTRRAPLNNKEAFISTCKSLQHHTEQTLTLKYTQQRYRTYLNIQTPNQSDTIKQLTKTYITDTLDKTATEENINTYSKEALKHHLKLTSNKLDWHTKRTNELTEKINDYLNNNPLDNDTHNILDTIQKEAHDNTIATKKYNYNIIFSIATAAYTHLLHNHSKAITQHLPNQQILLSNLQSLINTLDQITTTKQKLIDTQHHLDHNTIPAYLQRHQLEWRGPLMNDEMETIWNTTHHNNQLNYLRSTLTMLQLQETHLNDKAQQLKSTLTEDLFHIVRNIHSIHNIRHHRQTHNLTKLPTNFNLITSDILSQPFTNFNQLFDDTNFYTQNSSPQFTYLDTASNPNNTDHHDTTNHRISSSKITTPTSTVSHSTITSITPTINSTQPQTTATTHSSTISTNNLIEQPPTPSRDVMKRQTSNHLIAHHHPVTTQQNNNKKPKSNSQQSNNS